MTREILFRGKAISDGKWRFGSFIHSKRFKDCGNEFRIFDQESGMESDIDPETVGQFTGLVDIDGKKIFEGDKVIFRAITCDYIPKDCYSAYGKGQLFVVTKLNSGFTLTDLKILGSEIPNQVGHVDNYTFWNHQGSFEIIGNIHDNPELIEL